MEKIISAKTRLLGNGTCEVYVSKKIANHVNNKGRVDSGWKTLTETCGGKKMPVSQEGNGYYLCVSDQWVWFPI